MWFTQSEIENFAPFFTQLHQVDKRRAIRRLEFYLLFLADRPPYYNVPRRSTQGTGGALKCSDHGEGIRNLAFCCLKNLVLL